MEADLNGSTTGIALMNHHLVVGAGTQTYAGVDLQQFIGNVKAIVVVTQRSGGATVTLELKESSDNSTFATLATTPTLAAVTSASGVATVQSVAIDTRAVKRYIQLAATTGSSTATFDIAAVLVAQSHIN